MPSRCLSHADGGHAGRPGLKVRLNRKDDSIVTDARAPQRLYLMQAGTRTVPGPQPFAMSAGCYLVQTGDGQNILIDSGFPEDYTTPAGTPPLEDGQNVVDQLGTLGLSPDDIDTVICTHLDIDHVGYHDRFPSAEFIIQRQ